jgi:hypothetical protein
VEELENFVDRLLTRPPHSEEKWLDVIASQPLKEFVKLYLEERESMIAVCKQFRELESQLGISQAKEPSEKPSVVSIRDRVRQAASTFTRAEVQCLLDELDRFHLCISDCVDGESYHHLVPKPEGAEITYVWHRTEATPD